ncbi:MAG: class I SAM-dependent methyltransferase [Pyrinomonadaceae bacterium]
MRIETIYRERLQGMLRKTFSLWERLGVHVTPNHFYQPIPDTRSISEELWRKPSELPGVRMREDAQLDLLAQMSARFRDEYDAFAREKTSVPHQYHLENDQFNSVDAEMLHCMIRHFKPARVFEIGSGNSTYVAANAALMNHAQSGHACELVAFEPYPNEVLEAGFPGLTRLVRAKIQDVPLSEFELLGENDILFIDSSHVLKIGSDVQYEFLEVLPRLRPGVVVHVHDIFLPAEYPRKWVMEDRRFWTEQYLLQAFLAFNDSFEVLWGGSYMHLRHPDKLEAAFNSYDSRRNWPGSFWMRKTR